MAKKQLAFELFSDGKMPDDLLAHSIKKVTAKRYYRLWKANQSHKLEIPAIVEAPPQTKVKLESLENGDYFQHDEGVYVKMEQTGRTVLCLMPTPRQGLRLDKDTLVTPR